MISNLFTINNIHLKEAHSELFSKIDAKIPFVVWLLENPDSFLALPGKISLRNHDYIHLLLERGISPQDEAFVIGFTMGNDLKTNKLHLFIFKFFARFIYPYPYNFSELNLISFDLGFLYGRKIKSTQLNIFNFQNYENATINSLRKLFGIDADEIKFIRNLEILLILQHKIYKKHYEILFI